MCHKLIALKHFVELPSYFTSFKIGIKILIKVNPGRGTFIISFKMQQCLSIENSINEHRLLATPRLTDNVNLIM